MMFSTVIYFIIYTQERRHFMKAVSRFLILSLAIFVFCVGTNSIEACCGKANIEYLVGEESRDELYEAILKILSASPALSDSNATAFKKAIYTYIALYKDLGEDQKRVMNNKILDTGYIPFAMGVAGDGFAMVGIDEAAYKRILDVCFAKPKGGQKTLVDFALFIEKTNDGFYGDADFSHEIFKKIFLMMEEAENSLDAREKLHSFENTRKNNIKEHLLSKISEENRGRVKDEVIDLAIRRARACCRGLD